MKRSLISCAILGIALSGCGGGGGSSSSSATNGDGEVLSSITTGFVLPTEISAVPAESTATGIQINSFASVIKALTVAQLPSTSDYKTTTTKKYIEERELEQFEIIEEVMSAVSQTKYADPANINAGPYTAMIAWVDEQDGREIKTLEPWVVESRMIVENGQDVNRLLAWIEEPDFDNPGEVRLIKAEFKIYTSANVNADGSFADYGEWDMNVSFDESATGYFAASSRIDNGVNTIQIHEANTGDFAGDLRGILVRSGAAGSGKVSYPDYESCWQTNSGPNCVPPVKTAQYAYNTDYIVVDGDINNINGTTDAVYKDRDPANAVEMTHRYGLFYTDADANLGIAAGDNVERHKSFGFPLRFSTTVNGVEMTQHAYYGAWQGRHQIWSGDPNGIPAGTTVTRENFGSGQNVQTYTVSAQLDGTLTKRTLVDGTLSDIQGIPVEIYVNKHYDLTYSNANSRWEYCAGWIDWMNMGACMNFDGSPGAFADFTPLLDSLIVSASDRKHVNINRWDFNTQQNFNYVYLNADPSIQGFTFAGAGFYEAQFGQMGLQPMVPAAKYTPANNDNMWVDIGGSMYISYTGQFAGPTTTTGWVQKTLLEFDQQTWTPTFDDASDAPFSPELGRDYYVNSRGANFVVKRENAADAANSYKVWSELQTAANPVNFASMLPTGADYLSTPWRPEVRYAFVTTAGTNFMKLVFLTDDPNTADVDESAVATVVTSGEWGLRAYSDGADGIPGNSDDRPLMANGTAVTVDQWGIPTDPTQRPVEFNWEYSTGGWGSQQFLVNADSSYMILSDPIQLQPLTTMNDGSGNPIVGKTLSLQFDGWMHGLPDMYWELAKNDFQMSQEISDKVINIAEDTEVTDANDGKTYYVKPLDVSVFLPEVLSTTPGVPDIADADLVNLSTVPSFTPHGMGAKPTGTVVLYSEGIPVE